MRSGRDIERGKPVNPKLASLFLWIVVVGAAHMAEQIVFGVEEYHMLRRLIGGWWDLFPDRFSDQASVLLITIVFTSMSLMIFAALVGNGAALAVVALFGVLGVQEAHHWVEAIEKEAYDPGLVTSFAYVWVGALILREVWSQVAMAAGTASAPERA